MNTELASKEKEIESKSVELLSQIQMLEIQSSSDYTVACELLLSAKSGMKAVDEAFDPIIAAQYRAHREACNQKNKYRAPFVEAEQIGKQKIGRYLEEQERIRREEELKLQELARKQQEEMALQEAAALEDAGLHQEAEEVINQPVMSMVVLSSSVPKVQGISSRENYYAVVTDLKALCRAVADGKVPTTAVSPNGSFLNNQARALKGLLSYPGVQVQTKKVIAGKL